MRGVRQRVTEQFLAACTNGDLDGLMAVLAPGVSLYADSGGHVRAPRRPVVGADKVARFFLSSRKTPYREWAGVVERPDQELQMVQVNDGSAIRDRRRATDRGFCRSTWRMGLSRLFGSSPTQTSFLA